jgi:hypothetical protein
MESESEGAFRYRVTREAAHVDGVLAEGPLRRRHLREFHSFILGIPIVEAANASPFVVWEGSHMIIRDAFRAFFAGRASADWGNFDMTEIYHSARRRIFERCKRVEISACPGEAYLVHRLALHGVAPWSTLASAGPDGRMIIYVTARPTGWLLTEILHRSGVTRRGLLSWAWQCRHRRLRCLRLADRSVELIRDRRRDFAFCRRGDGQAEVRIHGRHDSGGHCFVSGGR